MSKATPKYDDAYFQQEGDVDALQRAAEVQADPKRHATAKKHAAKRLKEHDDKRKQLATVASKPSGAAHRSHLERKVKDGLKKAFPNY
jgi:hypothetical protein